MISGYEIDKNVVDTVKKARQKGYKTLICTNNFPARINGLKKRFMFLDNFDAWAFSYEVGATKPDDKIFETLVSKSGVNSNEIVFADDNVDNIKGANSVGINAFYYEGFDKFLEKLKEIGVNI